MFGIGFTELLVIAVVALIFIGPDKLPDLARTVGKTFLDLKRAADDIKTQVTDIEPGRSRAPAPEEPRAAEANTETKAGWADTRANTEAEAEAATSEAASEPRRAASEAGEAEKPRDKTKTPRKPRKKTGKTA